IAQFDGASGKSARRKEARGQHRTQASVNLFDRRQGTRRTGAQVRIGRQGVRRLLLPPLLVGLEPSRHGIPPLGQWRDSLYQRTLTEAYLDTNVTRIAPN